MRRLLATILSLALLAVTTGLPAWTLPAKPACEQAADACCEHPAQHAPASAPTNAACAQCCLLGCALILPPSVKVAAPSVRITRWRVTEFGGPVRFDQPPVPPPRCG